MAIHIKDIKKVIEIIRDTKKVLKKLEILIPVSDLHRLSVKVDDFLDDIDNETLWDVKKNNKNVWQ